jgi:hypothetical protein
MVLVDTFDNVNKQPRKLHHAAFVPSESKNSEAIASLIPVDSATNSVAMACGNSFVSVASPAEVSSLEDESMLLEGGLLWISKSC